MPCIVASFAAELQYIYTYIYTGLLDALYCSSAANEAIPATARSVLRVLRPGLFFSLFRAKKKIQKSSLIIDHWDAAFSASFAQVCLCFWRVVFGRNNNKESNTGDQKPCIRWTNRSVQVVLEKEKKKCGNGLKSIKRALCTIVRA